MEEIETLQSPSDVSLELVPCAICSRTFLPASLLKHSKVCEKNARKKRKIFDSLKQRIEGTDLAEFHQKSYLKSKQHEEPEPKLIKNNWKQKHMQLVEAIRAAKGTNNEQTENNEMKYQKRKSANIGTPTNTRCPSCDRNFGPKAYDRHVEWCKEKRTSEIHKSPASMLAKERLEARIKYKVPPLCKAKKITVKEKYSPTQNSPRNMKSASACTLDRSPSVRKSKNSIQRGGDSSQDEYLEKKVGDIGVKQVVSERILKDEVKNQNSKYDPFVSAERQFMELLECDDFKPFKPTKTSPITPKLQSPKPTQKLHQKIHYHQDKQKLEKSKNAIPNNKRASVIDPPLDFRDRLSMLNDDFDLIENLINENFTKTTTFHKNNEVNKKLNVFSQKFSDELNTIDPKLINETDNLSIPDHFDQNYEGSPTSTSTLNCFDTFLNGTEIKLNESMSMLEDVSNSFLEDKDLDEVLIALKSPDTYDKQRKVSEKVSKLPKKSSDKSKLLNSSAGCSAKKKNLSSLKRSISLLDQKPKPLKNKQDVQNYFNEQEKNSAKVIIHSIEAQKPPPLIMNDELFSVDDDMYEEYKKYEELYLKEREEELRKEEIDEEDNRNSKISADSAYGSLTRKSTPKTRARSTKLAPLDKHKILPDSPSSSSSESSPIPSNVPLKMSKFCHECGSKYPLAAAKFCVECGIKRLVL
nr:uncharacterized protein LOC111426236 isoform X2 [Onthophagus taurus]